MMKQKVKLIFLTMCLFSSGFCQNSRVFMLHREGISMGELSLGDEFNGQQLNQDLWYGYYPWGGLSMKAKTYTDPTMCHQKSGVLELKVDTTSQWRAFPNWMLDTAEIRKNNIILKDGNLEINRLTSALWSKTPFKYGFFECKCMLPKGQGLWPAFWLYGGQPNEEIDIMEAKGERRKSYHVDIHCPDRCDRIKKWGVLDRPFGRWINTKQNITDEWVTFSGLWTPEGIRFYYNGTLMASHQVQFKTEMNLIANFSMAMDKGPFSPGPNKKTKFPSTYSIDYIRAWEIPDIKHVNLWENTSDTKFIKMIPQSNQNIKFEYGGDFCLGDELLIYREDSTTHSGEGVFLILDLTAKEQWIDYSFWPPGKYWLHVRHDKYSLREPIITLP